jgi:hypothetical protein
MNVRVVPDDIAQFLGSIFAIKGKFHLLCVGVPDVPKY